MNLVRLLGFAFATLACGATYKAHMHRVGDAEKAKDEKALYAEAMAAAKVPGNFNRLDAYYRLAEYEFAKGQGTGPEKPEQIRRLPGEPASDGAVAPCASGRRSKA